MRFQKFLVLCMTLIACGCAFSGEDISEEMYIKASSLTKLSSMVEVSVAYGGVPAGVVDGDLLTFATKHDPDVLRLFDGYVLKASQADGHAVVVMCDSAGEVGLLLDLGCTAKLDEHLWNTPSTEACAAPKDAISACPE